MSASIDRAYPSLVTEKHRCCGCGGCYNICPAGAISMEPDNEGFVYPIVNKDKCIRCYKCIKVCIFKQDQEGKQNAN